MNNEPVAWIDPKELDMDVSTSVTKNKQFESDIPLYVQPQKYCPSENNEAYEKGFIDGMAKMTESAVHRAVEGMSVKELAVIRALDGYIKNLTKRTWVELTEDDKVLIKHDANFNQFMTAGEYADRVQALTEARLKDKNT